MRSEPRKRGARTRGEGRGQQKNRQLTTTSEGEMNYASARLEGSRKLIWRGGDARLIQAPFISKSDLLYLSHTSVQNQQSDWGRGREKGRGWLPKKWARWWTGQMPSVDKNKQDAARGKTVKRVRRMELLRIGGAGESVWADGVRDKETGVQEEHLDFDCRGEGRWWSWSLSRLGLSERISPSALTWAKKKKKKNTPQKTDEVRKKI